MYLTMKFFQKCIEKNPVDNQKVENYLAKHSYLQSFIRSIDFTSIKMFIFVWYFITYTDLLLKKIFQ